MGGSPIPISRAALHQRLQVHGVTIGTLVGCNALKQPLVSFAGAPNGAVVARIAGYDPEFAAEPEQLAGRQVLLAFEGDDAQRPLIVGLVRESLAQLPPPAAKTSTSPTALGEPGQALTVNGRSLHFDAQEEIVFRCGQGSIMVRADGSIIIRGTKLLSRAS